MILFSCQKIHLPFFIAGDKAVHEAVEPARLAVGQTDAEADGLADDLGVRHAA